MGTYTLAEGQFEIEPALTWYELRELRDMNLPGELSFLIEKETTETSEGYIVTQYSSILEPTTAGPCKHYYITRELEQIVEKFPYHKFKGYIELTYELGDDRMPYRLYVRKGNVIIINAEITWEEPPV